MLPAVVDPGVYLQCLSALVANVPSVMVLGQFLGVGQQLQLDSAGPAGDKEAVAVTDLADRVVAFAAPEPPVAEQRVMALFALDAVELARMVRVHSIEGLEDLEATAALPAKQLLLLPIGYLFIRPQLNPH